MASPSRPALSIALVVGLAVPAAMVAPVAAAAPTSGATASSASSPASPARSKVKNLPKVATMTGGGGAVASVDRDASQVGIDILRKGGNAVDAAVATAAALGVVEPFANGLGGGGFFVYYNHRTNTVSTIDGRESGPAGMTERTFLNADGTPMDFWAAVNSGLSVGVPGTPATWAAANQKWGTMRFKDLLAPAERLARRGFVVDQAFTDGTADNAERFAMFPATAKVFLPGGRPVQPGTVLKQPDLANTFNTIRHKGLREFYNGRIARAIVDTVNHPKTAPGVTVPGGTMTTGDLAAYRAIEKAPIHSTYHGYDVYGMPVPSSGGIAIAEALNLQEQYERMTGVKLSDVDATQYLHRFAESSATAFADRNRYVGDVPGVPVQELIDKGFAAERACGFSPERAQARPIAFGSPDGSYGPCAGATVGRAGQPNDGASTTHLTVADKWGNVVAYTLTIEQWGGSAMMVPGYGFLLNNEMTDFNFAPMTPGVPDPNLPAAGKRPRSSMSPTITLKGGRAVLANGAAGGATIITTTLQTMLGYLDRGMPVVDALNAPRLSSRNTSAQAEPELYDSAIGAALRALGQPMTKTDTIGRGTAIAMPAPGVFVSAAERVRGGGGSAMVVAPRR